MQTRAKASASELKGKLVVGDALIELRVQERFPPVGPIGDARDGVARQEEAENADGEKYRADDEAKDPVAGELTIAQAFHCVAPRARSRTRGSKPSSCCWQNSASALVAAARTCSGCNASGRVHTSIYPTRGRAHSSAGRTVDRHEAATNCSLERVTLHPDVRLVRRHGQRRMGPAGSEDQNRTRRRPKR